MHLKLSQLLFAIHLDNERDDEDEEGGTGDPGGLAGGLEELLGDEGGVAGDLLAFVDDGRIGEGGGYSAEDAAAVFGGGARYPPRVGGSGRHWRRRIRVWETLAEIELYSYEL